MANLSPQELTARAQQVFSDPRVAQAWAAWKNYHDRTGVWNPGHGVVGYAADFDQAVRATGLMPDGYQVGYNGPGGSPTLMHKGLPSWIYPLAAAGIAATAGAATGAFGAAAGGAAASGGGAAAGGGVGIGETAAVTGIPGAVAGVTAPAAATAGTSGLTSTLLRYGAPAIAGFAENYVNQKNETNRTNQAISLRESELDPFRGVMHQMADVAKLEHQANGPLYVAPPSSSPYSSYINPANRPPALSDTMVNATRNAQGAIASGKDTVPTMTDSHNWGKTGTYDLSAPWQPTAPSGTLPPPLPSTPTTGPAAAAAPSAQGLSYFQRMLLNARRRSPAA